MKFIRVCLSIDAKNYWVQSVKQTGIFRERRPPFILFLCRWRAYFFGKLIAAAINSPARHAFGCGIQRIDQTRPGEGRTGLRRCIVFRFVRIYGSASSSTPRRHTEEVWKTHHSVSLFRQGIRHERISRSSAKPAMATRRNHNVLSAVIA